MPVRIGMVHETQLRKTMHRFHRPQTVLYLLKVKLCRLFSTASLVNTVMSECPHFVIPFRTNNSAI